MRIIEKRDETCLCQDELSLEEVWNIMDNARELW